MKTVIHRRARISVDPVVEQVEFGTPPSVEISDGQIIKFTIPKGEKGEDGHSLTFEELTPEQKLELKGEPGDAAKNMAAITSDELNNICVALEGGDS